MTQPLHRIGPRLIALVAIIGAASMACNNASSETDGATATGSAAFPRTIEHVMGSTTIPAQPERVVVLDTGELDDVTLLGIQPVGAVSPHFKTAGGFPSYLQDKIDGTVDVGPLLEPNLEKIAQLQPDLILSSKVRHESIYGQLEEIAPTVFTETTGGPWKANLAVHAKALGLEKKAQSALDRYEPRAHALGLAIKKKNGGTMPIASIVRFVPGPTRLYRSNSYSGTVLNDIGFRRPESQISNDPDETMLEVSPEEIDQADADLIFVTSADEPDKTEQQDVISNPVWKDLPAVKEGNVFEEPDETWMSGIGVQAAEHILADVAEATGVQLPTP